jgi:DNA-binding XRE family transcriptional regulator
MELGIVGSIRTPFGEVELIPQDRNLLQASSVEPLQFRGAVIHLWAMLERMHDAWGVSGVIPPLLHVSVESGHGSSIAAEPIAAELLKSVTLLAGQWAIAHPEAFEVAAAHAFKFDQDALCRELGALSESLTCAAQVTESITSEALSGNSVRLREFSQKMRSMAFEMPTIQKIMQAVSYRGEDPGLPKELFHPMSRGAPPANTKKNHLRDVTGYRKNSDKPLVAGTTVSAQSLSTNQPTLGQMLKKQRKESGLSQQELALKLGVKAGQVAQLEDDRGPRPSFQLLSRVAGVLGLDKSHLFQLAGSGGRSSGARGSVFRPANQHPGAA